VTVCELGSVTAAAHRLGRSPGAVSATIQELEDAIGIALFVRKPAKGMAVTSYAQLLALEAKGLLAHADDFHDIVGALGSAIAGTLSVACFTNLAPMILCGLTAGFNRSYPGIELQSQLGDQGHILDSLRTGTSEAALTFDLGLSDDLNCLELAAMPANVVLPAGHRLAREASVSLSDVVHEPFALMDLPYTHEYFLSIFRAAGFTPRVAFRSTSFETIRTFVGNGLGYSLLTLQPHSSTTYDGTSVVHLPLREAHVPLRLIFVTLKSLATRRIVHTFQRYAAGYVKNWLNPVAATAELPVD
jgi:DNA-binding transcriptional LysR family regulator